MRRGAGPEEPPTITGGNLANKTTWDPPPLLPGAHTTLMIKLNGAEPGDVTLCGHSALLPGKHRVQLTAMSGEDWVEAIMHNVGAETLDVGEGRLRVVVMKVM